MKDEELIPYIGKKVELTDIDGDIIKGDFARNNYVLPKQYPYCLITFDVNAVIFVYKKSHIKKIREICE